jgi:hypothetical protein
LVVHVYHTREDALLEPELQISGVPKTTAQVPIDLFVLAL